MIQEDNHLYSQTDFYNLLMTMIQMGLNLSLPTYTLLPFNMGFCQELLQGSGIRMLIKGDASNRIDTVTGWGRRSYWMCSASHCTQKEAWHSGKVDRDDSFQAMG